MQLAVPPSVPAKPVKFTFFAVYPAVPKNVSVYVPAVKLKLIEFVSFKAPDSTVVATPVEFVTLTADVPVTDKFVIVEVFQTVPVPETDIDPEPKSIVLVLEFDDEKVGQVNEYEFKVIVPVVKVTSPENEFEITLKFPLSIVIVAEKAFPEVEKFNEDGGITVINPVGFTPDPEFILLTVKVLVKVIVPLVVLKEVSKIGKNKYVLEF